MKLRRKKRGGAFPRSLSKRPGSFLLGLAILGVLIGPAAPAGGQAETAGASGKRNRAPGARRLLSEIKKILAAPHLEGARAGVVILREGEEEPWVSLREDDLFAPASNMKLVSTAAALSILGKDHRFVTEVLTDARGESCFVRGEGDPSISGRHHDGDPTARLRDLARRIREAGFEEFPGDLVVDDSFFDEERVHPSWPREQFSRWYCAQIGALSLNDNCIDLTFAPGPSPGSPVRVSASPPTDYVTFKGKPTTGKRGSRSRLTAERIPGTNVIELGGTQPLGTGAFTTSVTIHDPGLYFGHVFREVLAEEGVVVEGRVRRGSTDSRDGLRTLARLESPIDRIVETTNKRSQNFYAEQLLKTVGRRRGSEGSFAAGGRAMHDFLVDEVGVPREDYRPADGSGLARSNRVTPRLLVRVLAHVLRSPSRDAFFLSLPISGIDGSLKKRMTREPMKGRVAAKTGYITGSGCLSGYLRGAAGETYVFSILINRDGWISNNAMKKAQDRICRAIYDASLRNTERTPHGG